MTTQWHFAQRMLTGWMRFWFPTPAPHAQLALIRLGTAILLLYVLFVRSFDLEAQFAGAIWHDAAIREALDPIRWPFSVFLWGDSAAWLWSTHVLAMVVATALLCGILTPFTAALSLALQLSYAHYNPAMLLGVDGLLILVLTYLSVVPSGRVLGVFGRVEPEAPQYPPYLAYLEDEGRAAPQTELPWSGLAIRLLQVHLCVLYVQSGLAKLTTDWVAGTPLWHPRLVALGGLYPLDVLQAEAHLTTLVTVGLLMFELLYPMLIWVSPLRYPLLLLALLVHIGVGLVWGLMPFNLLMLVLNLAFVPASHLDILVRWVRPLLVLPWVASDSRD